MTTKLFRFKVAPLVFELAVIETAPGEFDTEHYNTADRLTSFADGDALSKAAHYAQREIDIRGQVESPASPLDDIERTTLEKVADLYATAKRHYLPEAVNGFREGRYNVGQAPPPPIYIRDRE